jgi:Uma2 family endonuclease
MATRPRRFIVPIGACGPENKTMTTAAVLSRSAAAAPEQKDTVAPSSQTFLLHNVSWKTYECLLADFENSSAPRLAYDRGMLEIMSPLPEHEHRNRVLASLLEAIANEWGWDYVNLGSTTFKRQDTLRGFEPDSCFYLEDKAVRIRSAAETLTWAATPLLTS